MADFSSGSLSQNPVLIAVSVLALIAFTGLLVADIQGIPYTQPIKYISLFSGLCSVDSLFLMLSGNGNKVEKIIFIIFGPFIENRKQLPEKKDEGDGQQGNEPKKK